VSFLVRCLGWLLVVFGGVASLARLARRRPRLSVLVLASMLAGGAAGACWYAHHQWQAAQAALAADRPEEARQPLAFCLRVWPSSLEVHLLAARVARQSNDLEDAEAHLNRCLKLNRGATEEVQLEFLLLRVQRGELEQVAPALVALVEKDHPESPHILETLARAYMHRLAYRPAHACLSRWIELCPDKAKPYHWRGWVHERLDQVQEAMKDYQQALDRDPDLFVVRVRVGELLLEDNKTVEAFRHLQRLINQFPERPVVKARMGQCRYLMGEHEEARRLLLEAVPDLPRDPYVLLHLAKLDLQGGRLAESERWLRRALEVDPTDSEAHYLLASALQGQGRSTEAAAARAEHQKMKQLLSQSNKLLRDEAQYPSKDAARPCEIGTLLLQMGKESLGLHWLNEALQREAGHQPTLKALAEFYEKKGEWEKATRHRRQLDDKITR
jgi:tetratricopeptide (TPR) repeat protein